MKKLINKPDDVVTEALHGIAAAHPDLVNVQFDPNIIVRADAPVQGKVGLVSGGGSGHEPMHGGFVGMGMLDAACPGEVFTSPTPDQMLDATKAVDGGAGVLHIVKNYTGDVMNFEMAADLGGGPADLLREHRRADASPPRGVEAVLHGDIVVDHHGLDLDALATGELGGHLEVHHVARVVLDDVKDAGTAVDGLGRVEHLVRRRRREHLAGAGGVEHSGPDEAAVQWFVP